MQQTDYPTTFEVEPRVLTRDDIKIVARDLRRMHGIVALRDGFACFNARLECVGWAPRRVALGDIWIPLADMNVKSTVLVEYRIYVALREFVDLIRHDFDDLFDEQTADVEGMADLQAMIASCQETLQYWDYPASRLVVRP